MARSLTPGVAGAVAGVAALTGGVLVWNHYLVGVFFDDGVYASLAWALAHGQGYVYPNLPGGPAAAHYPPLYPLTLAPFFGLLSVPAAVLAGKGFNVACAVLGAALIAWHAVRHELLGTDVGTWLAPGLVAAAALAIPWLSVLTTLMSEPLFVLLAVAAILVADDAHGPELRGRAGAAGGLAAAALLVRSIGIALGIGIVVAFYRAARPAGRRSAWSATALAGLPLLLAGGTWTWWVRTRGSAIDPLLTADYGPYGALLRGGGATAFAASLVDLARPLGALTLNWVPSSFLYYVCGVPALVVGMCGLWQMTRRSAIGVTLIAYLGILAVWPVPPDRFLWAVLPWLALAWAAGAAALWRRPFLRLPVGLVALGLAGGFVRYEVRGLRGRWSERAAEQVSTSFLGVLGALDSLPGDAVIATDHEPLVWLYTGRHAVPLYIYAVSGRAALEPPPALHRSYLERQGVTHVLTNGAGGRGAAEFDRLIAAFPGWLGLVRHWPDGRSLYAVPHAQ